MVLRLSGLVSASSLDSSAVSTFYRWGSSAQPPLPCYPVSPPPWLAGSTQRHNNVKRDSILPNRDLPTLTPVVSNVGSFTCWSPTLYCQPVGWGLYRGIFYFYFLSLMLPACIRFLKNCKKKFEKHKNNCKNIFNAIDITPNAGSAAPTLLLPDVYRELPDSMWTSPYPHWRR